MNQFYLVWNPSNRKSPKHRHNTELAARSEAERLARDIPGQEFYVLRAVSVSVLPREKVHTTLLPAANEHEQALCDTRDRADF